MLTKEKIIELFDLTPTIKKMEKLQKRYPHAWEWEFDIEEFNQKAKEIDEEFKVYIKTINQELKKEKEDYKLED